MLEVTNLSLRRGDRLLFTALQCHCAPGEWWHLRGRNGSGKTTLLRALCGLLPPDVGTICWRGQPLSAWAEDYYRDVLFVGHVNGIKGDLTPQENLHVAACLAHLATTTTQLNTALAQVGLADYTDLPCRFLSQGQKKRVALARLVFSTAPLWLLDEPFTALDSDAVDWLQQCLADHVAQGGSVMLTTHQAVTLTAGQPRDLDLAAYAPQAPAVWHGASAC